MQKRNYENLKSLKKTWDSHIIIYYNYYFTGLFKNHFIMNFIIYSSLGLRVHRQLPFTGIDSERQGKHVFLRV